MGLYFCGFNFHGSGSLPYEYTLITDYFSRSNFHAQMTTVKNAMLLNPRKISGCTVCVAVHVCRCVCGSGCVWC